MAEIIAIIDYGSGNLRSAQKAFQRAAYENNLEVEIMVTDDADLVRKADRIVLPGVGAFADCRAGLMAVPGMRETLEDKVIAQGAPYFGICVGMQLMAERGLEKGEHGGFGWIKGDVMPITPLNSALKVPHMGWNTLDNHQNHPIFNDITTGPNGLHAYFVHSYHMVVTKTEQLIAVANYGDEITACVGRDNMVGTQFHPEKSQKLGLTMIANFLKWKP